MIVETVDKLRVVVCSVITHKAVESRCYLEAFKDAENYSGLRSACIIAVEVAKPNKYVALLVLGV